MDQDQVLCLLISLSLVDNRRSEKRTPADDILQPQTPCNTDRELKTGPMLCAIGAGGPSGPAFIGQSRTEGETYSLNRCPLTEPSIHYVRQLHVLVRRWEKDRYNDGGRLMATPKLKIDPSKAKPLF